MQCSLHLKQVAFAIYLIFLSYMYTFSYLLVIILRVADLGVSLSQTWKQNQLKCTCCGLLIQQNVWVHLSFYMSILTSKWLLLESLYLWWAGKVLWGGFFFFSNYEYKNSLFVFNLFFFLPNFLSLFFFLVYCWIILHNVTLGRLPISSVTDLDVSLWETSKCIGFLSHTINESGRILDMIM